MQPTHADLQLWARWASEFAAIPSLAVGYFGGKLADDDGMVVIKRDADAETAMQEIAWAATVMKFNANHHQDLYADFRAEREQIFFHVLFRAALGDDHSFDPLEPLDRSVAADLLEECGSNWTDTMRRSCEV